MILNQIKNYGSQTMLALLSGVLMTLAFPKIDWGVMAWLALVPLILAIRQVGAKAAFFLGFGFGMVHYISLVYWTVYTMHQYGNIPLFQAVFVLILLAGYLSLYAGLFSATVAWLRPKPFISLFIAPALWVCLEMIRNHLFTGFPWELLGYSQYDHLWLIQIADLIGVYGISGLIVFVNFIVAMVILNWLELPWQGYVVMRRFSLRAVTALIVVMSAVIGYGIETITTTSQRMAAADKINVAVVQGNIDQSIKWDPRFQVLTTVKYRELSLGPVAQKADLIIWPETATPFYLFDDPILTNMVTQGIQNTQAYFIIGSPSYASDKTDMIYYNSAYLISPEGKSLGKYDKVHLVPFGEYVPLKPFLPFIDKLVAQVGDFKSGLKGSTLAWDNHRVGVLICYEAIFPELARSMVANGADLLVHITNDAWFGKTSAAYQHLSMAVLRAVEDRRFMARAANTGISGFIDANGRIVDQTELFKETVATHAVSLLQYRSLYSRWGDWPLGLVAFGWTLLLIWKRYNHR